MSAASCGGSVTLLVVFGVQAGIALVLYPFLQAVLGWSGLLSTLALMPMAVTMMAMSGLAPKLAARIGARSTMTTGIALGGTGLALMAVFVSADGGYLSVLPGMLAMGTGMGLAMTPSTEAITSSLPSGKQGVASALNDVTRELGTALGVAMLGALVSAGYQSSIDDRLHGVPLKTADSAREGLANAVEAAGSAGDARAPSGPCRTAVLCRRLAAGHVGGRRRHGRPVRLRPHPRPEDLSSCHLARGRVGGHRRGRLRLMLALNSAHAHC